MPNSCSTALCVTQTDESKTIDAPGAGTTPIFISEGTIAYSINIQGTIAGRSIDSNDVYHAFLREPSSRFVTFDAPSAGTGVPQGTAAYDINSEGTIRGNVSDSNNGFHGFLRSRTGAFTLFNVPNAGVEPATGSGLNAIGVSTGSYSDATLTEHGCVRLSDGAIISFDPPGSTGTVPASINLEGVIAGSYSDGFTSQGFIRSANGAIGCLTTKTVCLQFYGGTASSRALA